MNLFLFLAIGTGLAAAETTQFDFCLVESCSDLRIASSLNPIHEEIAISNEETLVLLDIGGTLLQHADSVLHKSHENWKRAWLEQRCPKLSREEKFDLARVIEKFIVAHDSSWQRLEEWPELVEQAQIRKMKVIAFSKVLMEPSLRHALAMRLAHFGIPIQDDLPELSENESPFIYADGVIQTKEKLKGPVLKEVLRKMAHLPRKIIFVDDRIEQAESVLQACQELRISAVCFHYNAYETCPIDEAVANYQLTVLVKERRWVPEEEVGKILRLNQQ